MRQTLAELKSDLAARGPEITVGYRQGEANLSGGKRLVGFVRNQGADDIQLQALDGSWHLLSRLNADDLVFHSESAMPSHDGDQLVALVAYLGRLDRRPGDSLRVQGRCTRAVAWSRARDIG